MISIVIPIYNEEGLIDVLIRRTTDALESISDEFELLFVNDGSLDGSLEKLLEYHRKDKRIKVLDLSRNYGHQAAYTAGMKHSTGDYTILMDGDLQDPPELIEQMYAKITSEKLDVVYAKRLSTKARGFKKMFTRLFHYIFSKTNNIGIPGNVGNYCCMSRRALNSLLELHEQNRYLPGMRFYVGYNQGYIEFSRDQRESGKTKMSGFQLTQLAFDAIFSFSNLPIKFCLYIGILGIILSVGLGLFSLISKFLGVATPGWSSILLSIYFFSSVQLIFLGVVGEYVYRIYTESQNRPLYFIQKFYE